MYSDEDPFFLITNLEPMLLGTPLEQLNGLWPDVEQHLRHVDRKPLSDKFHYIKLMNDLSRRLPPHGLDHYKGLLRLLIFLTSTPSDRFNVPASVPEDLSPADSMWSLLPSYTPVEQGSSTITSLEEFYEPVAACPSDDANNSRLLPGDLTEWQKARSALAIN